MMLSSGRFVFFYAGKNGLGWRIGTTWYRLKPPWEPTVYSERYSRLPLIRFRGWRVTKRTVK